MSTDIAIPDQQSPGTDLVLWARQAEAAAVYAETVCATTMVPKAYYGKAAEAAAAILAGAELGFSPMASLRAFDNIGGTPAPKAMTLRAVVQSKGHTVRIVESTAERAVVDGRRKGETEWNAPSIWDIERAKKLPQYKTNPNYANNPAAMLLARATAEQCRWTASDAIMGMPYAAEEMDSPATVAPPATRRLTVAELDAAPAWNPVDDTNPRNYPQDPTADPVRPSQHRSMRALWRDLGMDGDENRAVRLADAADILHVDDLSSSADLTAEQADQVIAALRERKDRTAAEGGTDV